MLNQSIVNKSLSCGRSYAIQALPSNSTNALKILNNDTIRLGSQAQLTKCQTLKITVTGMHIIWSPVTKHDIELVEKVQRRFTKRLRELINV